MRYWYDTEFIEDSKTIDLISIGIVAEDGREYYAQSTAFNPRKASDWVKTHVLLQLPMCPWAKSGPTGVTGFYRTDRAYHARYGGQCVDQHRGRVHNCPWRSRDQLRRDVLAFINAGEGQPELWGYFSAYDHVALCQLFGTMMDLPDGWPMFTRDLQQWRATLGYPDLLEQDEGEHNALADARWTRAAWEHLTHIQQTVNH